MLPQYRPPGTIDCYGEEDAGQAKKGAEVSIRTARWITLLGAAVMLAHVVVSYFYLPPLAAP
jgi:hypothetical protein